MDEQIRYTADVADAEKKISSLFTKLQSGSKLSAAEIVQLILILDRLDTELAEGAAGSEKYAAVQGKLRGQADQLTAAYVRQAQAQDGLSKKAAGAKTGLDDFGRALGLPIGQVGVLFAAVSTLNGAFSQLADGGIDAFAEHAGLSDEETRNLTASVGFLSGALKGDLSAAFKAIIDAQVKYIANTDAILNPKGAAGQGIQKILEDRRKETAEMEKQAETLGKLVGLERARGGVTDETREQVAKLVEEYGEKLPAAFLHTIETIGLTKDQITELNQKAIEQGAELAKQQNANAQRFTQTKDALADQTFAILEGLGAMRQMGRVTKEEADAGAKAVLAQLDAYRKAGEEAPESLQQIAAEVTALNKQTKAGREESKKQVEAMLDGYAEAGEKIPQWLQDIAKELGAVDKEQRKASESAKQFLKDATETAKQYLEAIEGTVEGLKERTVATIASTRAAEKDGELTGKALEEHKLLVQDLVEDYERAGIAIPTALQQIIDRYGIMSAAAEESAERQREAIQSIRDEIGKQREEVKRLDEAGFFDADALVKYNDIQDQIFQKQRDLNKEMGVFGQSFADAFGGGKDKGEQPPLQRFSADLDDVGSVADKVLPLLEERATNVNAKFTITVDLLRQIRDELNGIGQ